MGQYGSLYSLPLRQDRSMFSQQAGSVTVNADPAGNRSLARADGNPDAGRLQGTDLPSTSDLAILKSRSIATTCRTSPRPSHIPFLRRARRITLSFQLHSLGAFMTRWIMRKPQDTIFQFFAVFQFRPRCLSHIRHRVPPKILQHSARCVGVFSHGQPHPRGDRQLTSSPAQRLMALEQ
jgi:hypothetical protein